MELRDRWALVTGASSGIGADIARELAARGANLVLVARRRDRLEALASELRRDHSVQTEIDDCDLQVDGAAAGLFERTSSRGRQITVLVNNAGFGVHGDFLAQEPDRLRAMVRLNVITLMELTQLYAREMSANGGGAILQVASIAGVNPLPSYAVYAATKAFVINFSEAIAHELQGRGVSVTALLPGATWTEFFDVTGQQRTFYMRVFGMSSPDVARIGVKAMLGRRHSVVAGWRNSLSLALAHFFPRHVRAWLTWQVNRNR